MLNFFLAFGGPIKSTYPQRNNIKVKYKLSVCSSILLFSCSPPFHVLTDCPAPIRCTMLCIQTPSSLTLSGTKS